MVRAASCPNCGAQVVFQAGASLLAVCESCSSAVARVGDDITDLEITGRVAPLMPLPGRLELGARGEFQGQRFQLVGLIQYDHGSGPWNEWMAAFEDGRWGWIAEARGEVYLMFEMVGARLPSAHELELGGLTELEGDRYQVIERRQGRFVSARGELPFRVTPGEAFGYADLVGPGQAVATVDFGPGPSPQHLFVGRRWRLQDLFPPGSLPDPEPREVGALALNCPNCGWVVALRAPDEAMRVTCGACDGLLDCRPGNELHYLHAVAKPAPSVLRMGAEGTLAGERWTVFGHMVRSVTYERARYPWDEYLLHGESGFAWLLNQQGHWTLLRPVSGFDLPSSSVERRIAGNKARFRGMTCSHYADSRPRVDAIQGEFYWKVAVGDETAASDFISPPHLLSLERTDEEINWTFGDYVPKNTVAEAFSLQPALLPAQYGIVPHQPNPHRESFDRMVGMGAWLSGVLLVLVLLMGIVQRGVDRVVADYSLANVDTGTQLATEEFELPRRSNMTIQVEAPSNRGWLFVQGELVNLTKQKVRDFGLMARAKLPEETMDRTIILGGVEPGTYVMRFKTQSSTKPSKMRIVARSNVFLPYHALAAFVLLWILPLLQGARAFGFENKRWAESDHGG